MKSRENREETKMPQADEVPEMEIQAPQNKSEEDKIKKIAEQRQSLQCATCNLHTATLSPLSDANTLVHEMPNTITYNSN